MNLMMAVNRIRLVETLPQNLTQSLSSPSVPPDSEVDQRRYSLRLRLQDLLLILLWNPALVQILMLLY